MAAPVVVQSIAAASAAAGPASITPTFGGASVAGNFLVLVVCVTGTTPTITSPASWTVVSNTVNNSIAMGIFVFPNNPGGITSVAVTVGGAGGGAAAAMFEYSGMPLAVVQPFEATGTFTAASTTAPNTTTSGNRLAPQVGELVFALAAFAAATVNSNTNTPDMPNSVGNIVSTSGAPNAQLACFWGLSLLNVKTSISLVLNASVAWQAFIMRFPSAFGQSITFVEGASGLQSVWPANNQGSIGIG